MKLQPSDPEIQTIINKIRQGRLDLQPNFQRGEVWSLDKKKRLIDTILREWHVPPIHVVVDPVTLAEEVLDGQQRLAAIRDFHANMFTVDGRIEPRIGELEAVNGRLFHELPPRLQRIFENFTIRYFKIIDYAPGEPGELFFRLNQPTNLTPAEKRNSFFGPVRVEIKHLVGRMNELGIGSESLGFTNLRMAYDDVLARTCLSLELGSLSSHITAQTIEARFRSESGFSQAALDRVLACLDVFASGQLLIKEARVRFNKATFYSWLVFLARLRVSTEFGLNIAHFLVEMEVWRTSVRRGVEINHPAGIPKDPFFDALIGVYNDRAGSRVSDVSSVVLRDVVTWYVFVHWRGRRLLLEAEECRQVEAEECWQGKLGDLVARVDSVCAAYKQGLPIAQLEDDLMGIASSTRWVEL